MNHQANINSTERLNCKVKFYFSVDTYVDIELMQRVPSANIKYDLNKYILSSQLRLF